MKKKLLFTIISIALLTCLLYLQFGQQPTVNHSTIIKDSNNYNLSLVITLNTLVVFNQKQVKNTLSQKVLNNDFENILFSYDALGLPQKVSVTVYTNAITYWRDLPSFQFQFAIPSTFTFNSH